MGTASADLGRLATFVSAAQGILDSDSAGLRHSIATFRNAYEAYQNTASPVVANGDLLGVGPAPGGEVANYVGNLERDRLFVEAVRRAFEEAGGGSHGVTTVGDVAFNRAFAHAVQEVALEHRIDPQTLLVQRVAITVDDPIANGIPPTSGFVNDPICTATGHFLEVEEDFTWPERLAVLRWRRVYSSRFVTQGPFGRGWASWASVACAPQDDGSVAYQGPDGQLALFVPGAAGGYERIPGLEATLQAADGGWELVWDWRSRRPGEVWKLTPDGRLASVTGTSRGVARFTYDDGRLVEVAHDSGGRRLVLDWERDRVVAVRSSCGREATYRYDRSGDLVHTGRVLGDRDYTIDEWGLIVEVRDADGVRLCRNSYDGEGRVLSQVTPYGREVTLAYHPGSRTVVSDTAGGPVETYEHDGTGRLLAVTDDLGHRMERSFDGEGRCTTVTGFDGATVRNRFDDDGRSASRVDADGVAEHWQYDDERRVTGHRIEGGPALTYAYAGDSPIPVRVAGPDGWDMALEVDEGVLRSVTDADGVTVSFEHDADGNVVATTNGLGAVTRFEPHVSGEVARMTAADGAVFEFERDPAGRMVGLRTPTGDEYRAEWSPAGRMTALVEPNGARTVYETGANGEVQRVVDALGGALELQHDQLARLVGVAAPGGAKWGFEYTAVGLLSMVTDPAGGVWQYGYDAEGRQVSATDPLGHEVRRRYNPAGRLVELTDRSGNATRFGHDALGRVVREESPEGAVATTEWDVWGRPLVVRSADGETLTYRYTPAGRVAGATTAGGRSWAGEYDAGGRLVAVTDAAGATTRFEWDVCDRMVATTSPAGRVTRWRHDALGRVVESDQGGRVWRTAYDHAGRVVAASDPADATTRYRYDLAGRVVAATDPLGATTRLRYDERGNVTGVVDAFGGLVTTTYDAMRRPIRVTDQLGRVTRIDRDPLGRPVRQELATGQVLEWRRNARGLTTDLRVDGRDAVVLDRDRAGRPVSIHEPGRNRTFSFEWTDGGKLRSFDVDGRELRWERDRDGCVTARHDHVGRVTRYAYDRAGRLSSVGFDGLARIELDRDADGFLVALRAPGLERRWDHDAGGLVVGAYVSGAHGDEATTFIRDAAGRVTEARSGARVTRYRYDAAGQLVAAGRGADAWAWHYDPGGRLAREDGPDGTRRFTYDEAHQLVHVDDPRGRTTFAYDAAGRRTAEDSPDGTRRFTWDGLGRLAGVDADGVEYRFDVDALGRLAGVDGTALDWDPGRPVSELLAIGDEPVISAAGRVLGVAGADGAPDWLAGDDRATTDRGDGRDPWGAGGEAGAGPALGYLGEVEVGGLVWLRNRVYDPATRQFLTPDPLPGLLGLPVASHPYHYADNNPVGMVDPLGLQGQPLSIEDYNAYRNEAYGWQVNNLVTVGLVIVGVALMFTGVGIVGGVLIGALIGGIGGAAPGVIHGYKTGEWDQSAIWGGALKGAVIGGLTGFAGGGLGALSRGGGAFGGMLTGASRGAATIRSGVAGLGIGAGSGTTSELYDLTPLPGADGQFNPESIAVSTVFGGATGAAGGAATFKPGQWDLPPGGGGQRINGRWYTEHALERMAPKGNPEVMATLSGRAIIRAETEGVMPGTPEFGVWWGKHGPAPRGVPPSVVEAEIANPGTSGTRVITNDYGDVVTVILE
jgi:RHS repeat-associated protein